MSLGINAVVVPIPSQTISTGRSFSLNNYGNAHLCGIFIQYTTTGTAGNRNPEFMVKDGSGNVLWHAIAPATIAASLVSMLMAGAGVASFAAPSNRHYFPMPGPFALPPGCSVTIADIAAIDGSDTINLGAITFEQ